MWSEQQEAAIKAVRHWINDRKAKQCFRLFGFAGSGKTTLAKELASEVRGSVLYACFTGKAALVLKSKGCDNACTIHSLIYKAEQDAITGEYTFRLNDESPVSTASLVIIDEVSMVGEELARDLLSFGVKVLVLGDPAQLPPVSGEGFFINAKPDVMLTEVHRQAAENPIIRMSMDVREGRGLAPGSYGDSQVILRSQISKDDLRELAMGADQVLCGLNKTRMTLNQRIRAIKGLAGNPEWIPTVGDRLVCLRNDREKGLLNGSLWNVDRVVVSMAIQELRITSLDIPDAAPLDVTVFSEFFKGAERDLHWQRRKESDELTYGWALTVHKSQGSQWPSVLVMDESRTFRQDAAKHLYTAITRAAERVVVVV